MEKVSLVSTKLRCLQCGNPLKMLKDKLMFQVKVCRNCGFENYLKNTSTVDVAGRPKDTKGLTNFVHITNEGR